MSADPARSSLREHVPGAGREEDRRTSPSLRRTIALGLKGGVIATAVMTVFRMPISGSPPPTANFWAKYVGDGVPEDYGLQGLVLHLAYGTAAGAAFAALFPSWTGSDLADEQRGVLRGIAYGLLLSAFGKRVLLEWLLDMDLDADERFVFHLSHVVYGLTLGAWVGSSAADAAD